MHFRRLDGPGGTPGAGTGTGNETNNQITGTEVLPNQGPASRAQTHPRGNQALQLRIMNALREQRRAAGLIEDDTPVSISQMLEGDRILEGKLANKSPEALNLAKGEITAIENEAVPNSPRDSFGYSRDINHTKMSMSNRRERIISLTRDSAAI